MTELIAVAGVADRPDLATPQQPGLAYVQAVGAMQLSGETVGQALARVARDSGGDRALVWLTDRGVECMTWAELYAKACAAGVALQDLNPDRGRVALVGPNSVDWIVSMFGCALAQMPVVPIGPSVTDSEALHMLSQTNTRVVLAADRVGDNAVYRRMCKVADQLSARPALRDIAAWIDTSTSVPPTPGQTNDTDEFFVQHTSGTTGLPKGAVLSHRAALGSARAWGDAIGLQAGEPWLNPLPLNHVGGFITGLLTTLSVAGTYTVVERFTAQTALRAIREIRPAVVALVPTMIIDLLGVEGVSPSDFASVRTVAGGASPVDPGLIEEVERRLGLTFLVGYGQSEAPAMAASAPSDPTQVRTQSLGHCLPGRDYYIRDAAGRVLPTGAVGELCVRGPLVMTGYLRGDGSIDAAVDDAGWLATGDLCSMDDQHVLTFRGRVREVIIRGGSNVYPAEVEQVLTTHPSVAEAAVFGVPDKRLGERVVAAVLPHPGGHLDPDDVAAYAEPLLSRYKRPTEWIVAATLPRTSTGKVRKHLLSQWYNEGTLHARCAGPQSI
ncbi:class I adenylate-forming enzyme family protein [Mycobacterium colombiense]